MVDDALARRGDETRSRAVVMTGMAGACGPVVRFFPQACRRAWVSVNDGLEQR